MISSPRKSRLGAEWSGTGDWHPQGAVESLVSNASPRLSGTLLGRFGRFGKWKVDLDCPEKRPRFGGASSDQQPVTVAKNSATEYIILRASRSFRPVYAVIAEMAATDCRPLCVRPSPVEERQRPRRESHTGRRGTAARYPPRRSEPSGLMTSPTLAHYTTSLSALSLCRRD
jgi:hypothetical protein